MTPFRKAESAALRLQPQPLSVLTVFDYSFPAHCWWHTVSDAATHCDLGTGALSKPHAHDRRGQRAIKRAVDVLFAGVGIVCLLPLFAVIAVAVKLSGPGPILHRRRVVGVNGRLFDAFKFRTMRPDADSSLELTPELKRQYTAKYKLIDDPRTTPLGRVLRKYSLDEFPQLFNVLRGEMSLVGPRIVTVPELEKYGSRADVLLSVRPALTGLWQVSGRQTVSYDKRVELDLYYIQNWSLWLDAQILARTPLAVLKSEGAM